MARKSKWQQFADNFNSVYNTGKDFFQDYESRNIMAEKPEEDFDDEGVELYSYNGKQYGTAPTGDGLRKLQYDRLGDMYNRWGDTDKALAYEDRRASIRQSGLTSDYLQETMPSRVAGAKGVSQSQQARGAVDASSIAADTQDRGLKPRATQANIDNTQARTEYTQDTNWRSNDLHGLNKQGKQVSNEGQSIQNQTNQRELDKVLKHDAVLSDIATGISSGQIPEDQIVDTYTSSLLESGIMTPPEAAAMRAKWTGDELATILNEGKTLAAEVESSLQGGLPGFMKWLDAKNGNLNVRIDKMPDGSQAIVEYDPDTNAVKAVRAKGKDDLDLATQVSIYAKPGGAVKLSEYFATLEKNALENRETEAEIGLKRSQKGYYDQAGKPKDDYPKYKATFLGDLAKSYGDDVEARETLMKEFELNMGRSMPADEAKRAKITAWAEKLRQSKNPADQQKLQQLIAKDPWLMQLANP